jgi:mono/diheme cytochrome c family protein
VLKAKWMLSIGGIVGLGVLGLLWLTGTLHLEPESPSVQPLTSPSVPLEVATGQALFTTHCAVCHGASAGGTVQGPSLLSSIYAPSHHSDMSFSLAVKHGARAHHWAFGDMPAVPHVSDEEVAQITRYVRWLQQQSGVR